MMKITMLFESITDKLRTGGWSESWYVDGNEATGFTAIDSVSKRRSGMLSNRAAIVGYRVQTLGGGMTAFEVSAPGIQQTSPDIPQMALNCYCRGQGVQNKKSFQLRGIPDSSVVGGDYVPTQSMTTNFSNFANALVAQSCRFRAKDMTVPQINVVSISPLGVFVAAAPMTFAPGSYIQVLRAKNTDGKSVNGIFYVSERTDGSNGKFLNWTGGSVLLKGKFRVLSYVYPLVSQGTVTPLKITTRKVGRPFFLYRGRQKRR